ncbi:hypothetical protein C8R47DRAFT_1232260 [Mycena vitilis]|nr:hypothetical protein C8R47DRAFT_1232260 [Mycena vitilis]
MASNSVLNAYSSGFLMPYTYWVCATVLAYDWLCTLDQEMTHLWNQPLSMGTMIFVLNRYLPFVDIGIGVAGIFTHNSPEICLTLNKFIGWLDVIGVLISEVVLMLRTFAIWERKRAVVVSLSVLAFCLAIPMFVVGQLELDSLVYFSRGQGCELAKASPIILLAYVMLMVLETTIFVLTVIKAYRDLRRTRQPWIRQFYRDGILFYVYLLAMSLANLVVPIISPPEYKNWLLSPQRVLHSVLCTRVLFFIRGHSRLGGPVETEARDVDGLPSTLVFASHVDQ